MENILEIKDILDKLVPREKKAAKKFFSRHYSNTKELQLLNIIESISDSKRINVENRICKLGYESVNSKSFSKLRNRLKSKLFDYLSSSISICEIRNIDSHSFLKHRLKKLLFQADVLLEKGLFIQSNDLLRTSLRLSQEYEQFPQILESLENLKKIRDIQGVVDKQDTLGSKILHFQKVLKKYNFIESQFDNLIVKLETQSLDYVDSDVIQLLSIIEEETAILRFERIDLIKDFLLILNYQFNNEHRKACSIVLKRLKMFKNESMKFDAKYKMMFYSTFVEILLTLDHPKYAQFFLKHKLILSKPEHYKVRLSNIENLVLLKKFQKDSDPKIIYHSHKADHSHNAIFFQCHQYFQEKKFRKALLLIDENIRSYPTSSVQQLDLMVLDLMCNFELKRYDLLEYKIQSYLKNLAYRSNFDIPNYYHIIHKILHLQLRSKAGNMQMELEHHLFYLNESKVNGLFTYRSFQPSLFSEWITNKLKYTKGISIPNEQEKEELIRVA